MEDTLKLIRGKNKIKYITFLILTLFFGCNCNPNPKDFEYKLELPDLNYDLSLYVDRGSAYAPNFCDIYKDYRNGLFKKVFKYNGDENAFKMVRINKNTVIFIKTNIRTEITDTTYFKLSQY